MLDRRASYLTFAGWYVVITLAIIALVIWLKCKGVI